MTNNAIISIEIMVDLVNSDRCGCESVYCCVNAKNTPISEVIAKIQKIKGVIKTKNQRIVSEEERDNFISSNQISLSQNEVNN